MKIKRILSFLLAAVLLFGFSGCGNRTEDEENSPNPEMTENNELVIYHSSTSLSPMLMEITEKYSAETGKKVSSKLAGTDFLGEMKTNSAAIYIIDTHSDLSEWHSGGLFNDFLTDSSLSSVTDKIHSGLYYSADGIGNYGIPLVLEGYGYIFDREMVSAIFGGENAGKLIDDLRTCSFTEFESFVSAVATWIASPSAAKIKIGDFCFEAVKDDCFFCASEALHYIISRPDTQVDVAIFDENLLPDITDKYTLVNREFKKSRYFYEMKSEI